MPGSRHGALTRSVGCKDVLSMNQTDVQVMASAGDNMLSLSSHVYGSPVFCVAIQYTATSRESSPYRVLGESRACGSVMIFK